MVNWCIDWNENFAFFFRSIFQPVAGECNKKICSVVVNALSLLNGWNSGTLHDVGILFSEVSRRTRNVFQPIHYACVCLRKFLYVDPSTYAFADVYQMAKTQYFMWSTFVPPKSTSINQKKKKHGNTKSNAWKKCDGVAAVTQWERTKKCDSKKKKKRRNLSRSVSQSPNWRFSFSCRMILSLSKRLQSPLYKYICILWNRDISTGLLIVRMVVCCVYSFRLSRRQNVNE